MAESLGHFLAQNAATLDSCASEPIHLSGAIQNLGALLVLDSKTRQIVGASENVSQMLDSPAVSELLNQSFADCFPTLAAEFEHLSLAPDGLHHVLGELYPGKSTSFDVICHEFDGYIMVEFTTSVDAGSNALRSKMRFTQNACARIVKSVTLDEALETAAQAMRELTGFAKTMVYQFMPDWSGHVVAESRDENMPAYLGLFFPAHDIPEQARHLYSIMPSRSVGSVDDDNSRIAVVDGVEQLDLTYSLLRSVSPMHTAYFRNMGLHASFSVGLRAQGKLWGLFVCHHTEPGMLPLDVRRLAEDIAGALAARLAQEEATAMARKIQQLREIEASVAASMLETQSIGEALKQNMPALCEFMAATGFAVELGGDIHCHGAVPPKEFIAELIELSIEQGEQKVLCEAALPQVMPAAKAHRDTCCGVLLQPVKLERSCMLIWFRGPMLQLATWAGDPTEKAFEARPDGTHMLSPRQSFERWSDTHLDIALPWSKGDIDVAQSLFQQILDLIALQAVRIQKLSDANEDLAAFTHSTVHDIRGPLRSIDMALAELRDTNPSNEKIDIELRNALARAAEVSVDRLSTLIEQVLTFIEIDRAKALHEWFELADALSDVENLLHAQIRELSGSLKAETVGAVYANRALLTAAIQNLVQNSLNYKHPERDPVIRIDLETNGDKQRIIVTDNGIGVEEQFAERIFEPFKRLHRRDEIEGTGIGLASVLRVAELHGGTAYLDTSFEPAQGARFVVEIETEGASQG